MLPLIALWEVGEKAIVKADLKGQLDFPSANLGSVPLLPVTVIPLLIYYFFLVMSQRCAHMVK